jgi:hypothetical protein
MTTNNKPSGADSLRKGDKFRENGRTFTVTRVRTNHVRTVDEQGNVGDSPLRAIQLLIRQGQIEVLR